MQVISFFNFLIETVQLKITTIIVQDLAQKL